MSTKTSAKHTHTNECTETFPKMREQNPEKECSKMRKGLLVTQWPEIRLDGGGVSYADAVRRDGGSGSKGRVLGERGEDSRAQTQRSIPETRSKSSASLLRVVTLRPYCMNFPGCPFKQAHQILGVA